MSVAVAPLRSARCTWWGGVTSGHTLALVRRLVSRVLPHARPTTALPAMLLLTTALLTTPLLTRAVLTRVVVLTY